MVVRNYSKTIETYSPGEFIWKKDEHVFKHCFLVTEGEVELVSEHRLPRKRGPGEILGTTSLGIRANGMPHNTFRVPVDGQIGHVKGFKVPKKIFLDCMADNAKFREDVWTEAFPS